MKRTSLDRGQSLTLEASGDVADSSPNIRANSVAAKILGLLDDLKASHVGAILYDHLESLLEAYEQQEDSIQLAYARLVSTLLEALKKRLPADSPQILNLRLIKKRLQQPLTAIEIETLRRQLSAATAAAVREQGPADALQEALAPLFQEHTDDAPSPYSAPREEAPSGATKAAVQGRGTGAEVPDRRVDISYRKHLNEKRDRISKIQETLAHHVNEVIKQNERFGILLEVERETLRQINDQTELSSLKESLTNEVERLLEGHHGLAQKLDKAAKYLQLIETEGQHLNEELTRVHILSLTDELTELPNRRAFTRRLEDEVARVQRYGYPLSLCLIDMDGFKAINDRYGHAAGDEVLRNFSTNVLSIFRHHDMVARYGGEEFAVLLPNTDKHGAMRALAKVRKRALSIRRDYG
jgi:diguanylate cyclase